METMWVDIFSATFYAMRSKYKKKYKLLTEDQTSYYFECLFILSIQVILFVSLYISDSNPICYKEISENHQL